MSNKYTTYSRDWNLKDNYIYISHLDGDEDEKWLFLPNYPDSISISMNSTFDQTNALSRTAPVFTYSNSGPRSMQITLNLHRDLMQQANEGKSNLIPELGDDYLDTFIKKLQSIAVPKYNLKNKLVEPPLVAIRFCDQIFIKGIVSGSVGVNYMKPILRDGTYAKVDISFTIYETDPYDATTIAEQGGFRGLTRTMKDFFRLEE